MACVPSTTAPRGKFLLTSVTVRGVYTVTQFTGYIHSIGAGVDFYLALNRVNVTGKLCHGVNMSIIKVGRGNQLPHLPKFNAELKEYLNFLVWGF